MLVLPKRFRPRHGAWRHGALAVKVFEDCVAALQGGGKVRG